MKLETYAKLMNQTENFPWTKNVSSKEDRENPISLGNKKERINNLARELFTRNFNKKYEGSKIYFQNQENPQEEVVCDLKNIKFNANWSN